MCHSSVYPRTATPQSTAKDADTVYEISESEQLPVLDLSRAMYTIWLPRRARELYRRCLRRLKGFLLVGYCAGMVGFVALFLVPAPVGRWIGAFASLPMSLTAAVYFSLLRYDVVCLLVRTYEFWFFSVSNLVSSVLLAVHLGDARAVTAIPLWFGYQNNLLTDANTAFTKSYVSYSLVMLLSTCLLIVVTAFDIIDGASEIVLLHFHAERQLAIQDAIVQGFTTQAIMLGRNIYRRWTFPVRRFRHASGKQYICVTLRARVKLQEAKADRISTVNVEPRSESTLGNTGNSSLVRMKLVPISTLFRADNSVVRSLRRLVFTTNTTVRRAIRSFLLFNAYSGLVLFFFSAFSQSSRHHDTIRLISFGCTLLFVTCLSGTPQRQLLRRLVFTFDFAFLSLQIAVIHACLCDMLGWGYPSLSVVTFWLWIQWVLSSDAVPPIVKAKWGIRRRLPGVIMFIFMASQLFIVVTVAREQRPTLRDRVIISVKIRDRCFEMKVIPVLLSRMVIMFGWSWKILWRMWTIKPHELLFIQGGITYGSTTQTPVTCS